MAHPFPNDQPFRPICLFLFASPPSSLSIFFQDLKFRRKLHFLDVASVLDMVTDLRKRLLHLQAGNQLGLIRPDFIDRTQVPLWGKEFAHIGTRHTIHTLKPFLFRQQAPFHQHRLQLRNTRGDMGFLSDA